LKLKKEPPMPQNQQTGDQSSVKCAADWLTSGVGCVIVRVCSDSGLGWLAKFATVALSRASPSSPLAFFKALITLSLACAFPLFLSQPRSSVWKKHVVELD
jgi:hypothetical protein